MNGLTQKQKAIYDFIAEFLGKYGHSPSYREILSHFAFSSLGTVHKHLAVLQRKGVLTVESKCSRSIRLVPLQEDALPQKSTDVQIPFIGQLTANSDIETFAQIHTLSLPSFMVGNPDTTYVLRARGDVWSEEHIADGDLVIVEAQREASPNETAIVRINGSLTTIRRVLLEGQYVRLIGRSASSEPVVFRADQVEIQGIVIGVIRLYS